MEGGGEGGGERNINVRNIDRLPPVRTPIEDQTYYLGTCPDWV